LLKEFIEDNTDAITGVLYFWEHVSELNATGTAGHNFAGYIGGYATRTIATGVSAINAARNSGPVDIDIEAVSFRAIPSSVEGLRIRYRAANAIDLEVRENGNLLLDAQGATVAVFELPASGGFTEFTINACVVAGGDISLLNLSSNAIEIDYLNIFDADGVVACAPNVGAPGDFTYTEPAPYIPIGQGFFVGADADGGTITFDNSQREYITEGAGQSVFLKSDAKTAAKSTRNNFTDLPVIKLGMSFKDTFDNNDYHRQIAISFSPFQSFAYDKGYDAEMFDIGATDFYWKFPELDNKFIITGVGTIENSLEVPLEIVMGYSGGVSIMIDEMKNVDQQVYINDKVTGVSYELIGGVANLNLEQGTYTDRFVLAFTPNEVLATDGILNAFTNMYLDNLNRNVVVNKTQDIDRGLYYKSKLRQRAA